MSHDNEKNRFRIFFPIFVCRLCKQSDFFIYLNKKKWVTSFG